MRPEPGRGTIVLAARLPVSAADVDIPLRDFGGEVIAHELIHQIINPNQVANTIWDGLEHIISTSDPLLMKKPPRTRDDYILANVLVGDLTLREIDLTDNANLLPIR